MSLCLVEDIPIIQMLKFRRAGVIPYKKVDGTLIFGLGIDRGSGDVSNFAGSILQSEECIRGAFREFMEESFGCFGRFNGNSISACLAMFNDTELIIFVCCEWTQNSVISRFKECMNPKSEMKELFFCNGTQLLQMLYNQHPNVMYSRVKDLFLDLSLIHI